MRKALAAVAFLWAIGSAAQAQENPVVVELFTSQGCSSCPPADALLRDLATRDDIIALALHVDYWDYIGWKDEFASPAHTERQRRYARVANARAIYTPQMVIGGTDHVVGTKPMEVTDAIRAHQRTPTGFSVQLRRSGETLRIEAQGSRAPTEPLVIQLVRYEPEATVDIRRGENAGRTLSYSNIVESWQVLGQWDDGSSWVAETRVLGQQPIVVIVQEAGPGLIVAAAQLN